MVELTSEHIVVCWREPAGRKHGEGETAAER
jgi:hypothetical protein